MSGDGQEEERTELVRRLFAAMTMALEDLASEAAEGQAPTSRELARKRAERVRAGAELVVVLAEATSALAR